MQLYVVKFYSKEHPDVCARELHTADMSEAIEFIVKCRESGLYNRCEHDGRIYFDHINKL